MTTPNRDNKALMTRLSKIEGQIRGIKKMIEENKDCGDIIIQISSASAALSSTANVMLEHHIDTCVLSGVTNGDAKETLDRLKEVTKKCMKVK